MKASSDLQRAYAAPGRFKREVNKCAHPPSCFIRWLSASLEMRLDLGIFSKGPRALRARAARAASFYQALAHGLPVQVARKTNSKTLKTFGLRNLIRDIVVICTAYLMLRASHFRRSRLG